MAVTSGIIIASSLVTVVAESGSMAYAELALRIGIFAVARRLGYFEAGVNPRPGFHGDRPLLATTR